MTSILGYDVGDWGFDLPDLDIGSIFGGDDEKSDTVVTSPVETKQEGGGTWWKDRRIVAPVLESVLGLAGGYFTREQQKDLADQAREDKKNADLRALELEKLKYKYGLAGGKGGGGGGGGGAARNAQMLAAYQNYIQGVAGTNVANQASLRSLGNTISGAYANGRIQ